MRTRWLVPFTISLGLTSTLAIVACKNDDGGKDQADGGSESDGDSSTTETSTTKTDDTTTDEGDTTTTTGCTPGELGCDCNNGLCLGDLECVAGTCVNPECIPGELGCECNNDLCLADLVCNNGICSDPNCTPGELACECNNGLCLGELVCENDVCVVGGDTDTDTADTTETDTGMECRTPTRRCATGSAWTCSRTTTTAVIVASRARFIRRPIPMLAHVRKGSAPQHIRSASPRRRAT